MSTEKYRNKYRIKIGLFRRWCLLYITLLRQIVSIISDILFQEQLGYDYIYGPDVKRDYAQPLHVSLLRSSLQDINSTLPKVAIEETINKITTFEGGTLVQKNARFHDFLQNGVDINYFNGEEMQSTQVRLVDYDLPLLIEIICNFICYFDDVKILAAYHQFYAVRKAIESTIPVRLYFEAVKTLLTRIEGNGKISFKEVNERINELLKQSIKSEGVINLFSDVKEEFSLFDPKFLEEISRMKEKNFAVELLRKLIAEQIRIYERTNAVRASKFSEILSSAMSNYLKGMLTNEEVIAELMKAAQDIMNDEEDALEMIMTQCNKWSENSD